MSDQEDAELLAAALRGDNKADAELVAAAIVATAAARLMARLALLRASLRRIEKGNKHEQDRDQ